MYSIYATLPVKILNNYDYFFQVLRSLTKAAFIWSKIVKKENIYIFF